MAKRKKNEEGNDQAGIPEAHLKPMEESDGPPARPEAVDPAHLEPQAEVEPEQLKVKVADPSHLKPQGE